MIPLFPLGTVLFPGAPLALHIFEARYRTLMADLLELPAEQRRFGVIAIRSGREVGTDGARALHDVGCMAVMTAIEQADDGTYELESVGSTRFRLLSVDDERPYLRGEVEWLPEPAGDVGTLAEIVTQRYADYRRALGGLRGVNLELAELPDRTPGCCPTWWPPPSSPTPPDRQRFLAELDAAGRLAAEARWLALESALLRELSAVPAGRLIDVPSSMN